MITTRYDVEEGGILAQDAIEWLLNSETGRSSENMVRWLALGKTDGSYPLDPSDLRRCMNVLNEVKGLRDEFFSKMHNEGPVWKALMLNWSLLVETLRYEMKTSLDGKAPKTNQLMQEIISKSKM